MSKLCTSGILFLLIICSSFGQQQVSRGKELYEKNCARCHGANGTKHFLFAKSLEKSIVADTAIVKIIFNGKKIMPSFKSKLTKEEIQLIAVYVKRFRK